MVELNWLGNLGFEAQTPSGHRVTLDGAPAGSAEDRGPSPMEMLLTSLAACGAIDVISILEKKRQKVTAYRIEIEGVRPPAGEWPRPFNKIVVRHILEGEQLDSSAVERAIALSDEKYCSVTATLRARPEITSEYRIEPASGTA